MKMKMLHKIAQLAHVSEEPDNLSNLTFHTPDLKGQLGTISPSPSLSSVTTAECSQVANERRYPRVGT